MSTPQVAINGLKRSLMCVNRQLESKSSFYTSGIENLLEIRELASQIMEAANATLARVNLDDDRYVIDTDSGKVDIVELTTTVATAVVGQVISNLNLGNLGQTKVEFTSELNAEDKESPGKQDNLELDIVSNYEPSKNVSKNLESISTSIKSTFTKDFKQAITKSCNALEETDFYSYENCANLLRRYFQVRFDKRNDPNNIHKFDRKQFRNYLASFVLAYGKAWRLEAEEKFTHEVNSWLEEVQTGTVRYTMPPSVAEVFFNLIHDKTEDLNYKYRREWWTYSCYIWEELWKNGLAEFSKNNLANSPEPDMEWLHDKMLKHAVPEADYSCGNLYSCQHIGSCDQFSMRENFDIGYMYVQKELGCNLDQTLLDSIKEAFLTYQQYLGWSALAYRSHWVFDVDTRFSQLFSSIGIVPFVTCAKSFIFYAITHPDKVQELQETIAEMWDRSNDILENVLTDSELDEVIQSIGVRKLEVVDVYLNYLDNYEEAAGGLLHPSGVVSWG